jgi:ABC-2 type transport system permease protein
MSVYLHVARKSFQRHLAYRAANLAGIATNLFFGSLYVFIYIALFKNRETLGGLDVRDTVTYAIITQALLMAMSAFGNRELSEAIIGGQIVTDLSRPLDFYLYWGAIDLGRSAYYLIFRGIPTFVLGLLIFHARLPRQPEIWLLFLLAVSLGMLASFAFRFIVSSLAFWTTDSRGINYLVSTTILFFAGFIVPLSFFPDRLRHLTEWLPFRAMAHLPVSIYLGRSDGMALWRALGLQVLWLITLVLIGRVVLRNVVRRLSIHGG